MRRRSGLVALFVSVVLSLGFDVSVRAQLADNDFYNSYIANKLEIGTRITHVVLLEDSRGEPYNGSFVGSITMLKEDQDYLPTKFYVQYKFMPCLGIGLSYDRVGAEAWDHGGTDGTTVLSGPLLYLLGCYPNSTKFTPFCELGAAFYSADFDAASGWSMPGKDFVLDNTQGFYLALGCDWQIMEQFSVNVYGRYVDSDVDGVYTHPVNSDEDIIFTMSHLAFGVGAKFTF